MLAFHKMIRLGGQVVVRTVLRAAQNYLELSALLWYLLYSRQGLEVHDLQWLPLVSIAHDTVLVLFIRSGLTLD